MSRFSHIAVLGAGAIGCYYGAMLARAGTKVTLIGRRKHVDPINRDGLAFISLGRREQIRIAATDDVAEARDARLILFCVKSADTDQAAQSLAPHLAPDAVILSLQNGVDNAERIRAHVRNPVMPALVYAAAQMEAPGCVEHTGGGSLIIGQGEADEAARRLPGEIAELFGGAGVPIKISANIDGELWTKLVMNCAYNAISALTGTRYGRMVAMPEIVGVMRAAVDEVVAVARAKGIRLPHTIADATVRLAEAMPQTISSTAQDIAKGKRTEIDHLNGYVVRQGNLLGVSTPVNQTLSALIKLLEQAKPEPRAG